MGALLILELVHRRVEGKSCEGHLVPALSIRTLPRAILMHFY